MFSLSGKYMFDLIWFDLIIVWSKTVKQSANKSCLIVVDIQNFFSPPLSFVFLWPWNSRTRGNGWIALDWNEWSTQLSNSLIYHHWQNICLTLCLHTRQPVHNFKILYAWNLFAVHYHVLFRLCVPGRYVIVNSHLLQVHI